MADLPKVWIVNFSGHNYSDADRFGTLEAVTVGNISRSSFDRLAFEITQKLSKSSSEDWLLLSGALIANVIAVTIWFRKHGELRALVWDWRAGDGSEGAYRELKLTNEHVDFLLNNVERLTNVESTPSPESP